MRILILGCGYLGTRLGRLLVSQGHEVFGLRRGASDSNDLLELGIRPIEGDLTKSDSLQRIAGPFDWVVNAVSSSKGGVEIYKKVYLEGGAVVLDWMRGSGWQPASYLVVSSTSVYAQTDGSWVTEESPAEGASETSRVLVQAERLLLEATRSRGFPAIIMRAAGIYGPDRGHLFLKHLRGEATMAMGGLQWINMIHVEDLARACVAALERGLAGEVYNAVDNEPVRHKDFFAWFASRLGLPLPPIDDGLSGTRRKRGVTQKRISNEKLRLNLLGTLQYPTFREGYEEEIKRLQLALRNER